MAQDDEQAPRQVSIEIALPVQVAGLVLLVLFAGTFGLRWAVLALAVELLFVGWVFSGARITVDLPAHGPATETEGS